MSYQRRNVAHLAPYTPGEQPDSEHVIKLNTNENPYPPANEVLKAISSVNGDMLRRYPQPTAEAFRQTAAKVHELSPDMIISTNGGDELLRLAITVFCEPRTGDQTRGGLAISQPTYSLFTTLGQIHDTPVTQIPLGDDWSLAKDFSDIVRHNDCRLAILVNPHAPTGCLRSLSQLEAIARQLQEHAVLLVDEAYVDFAAHDAISLLRKNNSLDNVLLLRTLSKGYSLAGLRFGYGLGHPSLIEALTKARDSYANDVISQVTAIAALEHRDQAAKTWQAVKKERSRLTMKLTERGFDVVPSESNFLLCQPAKSGPTAKTIYESLKKQGIFVRYFDQSRLCDRLRITVGQPAETDALLLAIDAM